MGPVESRIGLACCYNSIVLRRHSNRMHRRWPFAKTHCVASNHLINKSVCLFQAKMPYNITEGQADRNIENMSVSGAKTRA